MVGGGAFVWMRVHFRDVISVGGWVCDLQILTSKTVNQLLRVPQKM